MGTVQKKHKSRKRQPLSEKQRLEKDLRDCMKCKFFWGNNNRCISNECYKEKKEVFDEKPKSECDGCPYNQGMGYCFPCLKKIMGK